MTFWIIISILLVVVFLISAFGPYLGIYGDVDK